MKAKIFILFLFISTLLVGQEKLSMSSEIEKYVQQVVDEGAKRNVPIMDSLMKRVDYIIVDYNLNYPYLGLYYKEKKTIYIAGFTLIDSLMVRTAVFHEIGHALSDTKSHPCIRCGDIMSEAAPETFARYYLKEDWEEELNRYFAYIKSKLYEL